ncbi:hypothetical protein [Flammeovirga pacifica]|nr:hypothetical protein [Flammeovirga pacifica]
MKIIPKYLFASLLLLSVFQLKLFAQNQRLKKHPHITGNEVVWNGSQNSDFNNSLNWTPNIIPNQYNHDKYQIPTYKIPANTPNILIIRSNDIMYGSRLIVEGELEVQDGGIVRVNDCDISGKVTVGDNNNSNLRVGNFSIYVHLNILSGGLLDLQTKSLLWGIYNNPYAPSSELNIHKNATFKANNADVEIENLINNGTVTIEGDTEIKLHESLINNIVNGFSFTDSSRLILTSNSDHNLMSSGLKFNEIELNTTGAVILKDDLHLSDEITFGKGIITAENSNIKFIFEDGSDYDIHTSPSSNSHLAVKVIKEGFTDTFTFPVGDGTKYHPIKISKPGKVSTIYEAQYKNNNLRTAHLTGNGQDIAANEYWVLNATTANPSPVVVSLYKKFTEFSSVDSTKLDVIEYDSSKHEWISDAHEHTLSDFVSTDGPVTEFGVFTLHDETIGTNLPIKLISFNATLNQKEVDLKWSTASEENNEKFVVERSFDQRHWETVKEIQGAGNSNTQLDYEVFDELSNTNEKVYYRLTQIDFDGNKEIFSSVSIGQNDDLNNVVSVFPDPVKRGNEITIQSTTDEVLSVKILSLDGKEMDQFNVDHLMTYKVNTQDQMIFVEIVNGQNKVVKKVIVQ